MHPWTCALLISLAGGIGGIVNALLSDKLVCGSPMEVLNRAEQA